MARATLKSELGIESTDTSEDTRLDRILAAVGVAFSGRDGLRRPPWRQRYTEQGDGDGSSVLLLSRYPVGRIVSITESGVALDATAFSIVSGHDGRAGRDALHRASGRWASSSTGLVVYVEDYFAGWLMPAEVTAWEASKAYTLGAWVSASSSSVLLLFEATAIAGGGTSGASEPDFASLADGETVVDNEVTWTARAESVLPEDVQEAALMQAVEWAGGGLEIPAGVKREAFESMSVEYRDPGAGGSVSPLSPAVSAILEGWR